MSMNTQKTSTSYNRKESLKASLLCSADRKWVRNGRGDLPFPSTSVREQGTAPYFSMAGRCYLALLIQNLLLSYSWVCNFKCCAWRL